MNHNQKKKLKRAMACSLALGSVGAIVLPSTQAIVYAAVNVQEIGPSSNPQRPSNFPESGDLERLILWEQPRDDSPTMEVYGLSGADEVDLTLPSGAQNWPDDFGDGPEEIYRSFRDRGGKGVTFPIDSITSDSKVVLNYTNVGAYKGRPVDCKVTFHDMKPRQAKSGVARIKASNSMGRGWITLNLYHWRTKVEFYQDGSPIYLDDAKSLFTINSLNPEKDGSMGEAVAYSGVGNIGYVTSDTILSISGDYFYGDHSKGGEETDSFNYWKDDLFDPTFSKGSVSFEADPSRSEHDFWFLVNYDNRNDPGESLMWFTIKTDAIWERTTTTKLERHWKERQPLPNDSSRRFNPKLPVGTEKVIRDGQEGYRERIWTETVYPDGNVTRDVTPWENHPGSDRLVEFGPARRSKTENREIPYDTIRRPNPKMKNHTERVVQNGVVGKESRTVTWLVNPETEEKVPGSESGGEWQTVTKKQDKIIEYGVPHPPKIWGVHPTMISDGERLNLMHGISADDFDEGDLSDRIKMSGEVDYSKDGSYPITYTVTDSDGDTDTVVTNVIVRRFPVEEMIRNLKNIYNNLQENINKLPDQVRDKVKNHLKPQLDEIGKAIKDLENTDHVQRQQFDDLIKRIAAVEKEIAGLKEEDKRLEGEIGDVEKSFNAMKDHVNKIEEQINKHYNWLESLEKRVKRLEEHTNTSMERVKQLDERLKAYEKDMDKVDKRYHHFLKDLKAQITSSNDSLKEMKDTLSRMGETIAKHTDDLDQVEEQLKAMDKHLDDLTPKVEEQGKQLESLKERFSAFDKGLGQAKEAITRLEEKGKALKQRLEGLSDQQQEEKESLQAKIDDNAKTLETLKQRYQAISEKELKQSEDLSKAQEDVDQLNDQLKSLTEDVEKQNNSLTELANRLEASEETYSKLKESLIRKEEKAKALEKQTKSLDGRFDKDKDGLLKQLSKTTQNLDHAKKLIEEGEKEDKKQTEQLAADKARIQQIKKLLKEAGEVLDKQADMLNMIESSLNASKEGLDKLNQQIDHAAKKKDELSKIVEATFGEKELKDLNEMAQHSHKQLEELQKVSKGLKLNLEKGSKQSEDLKRSMARVDKITKDLQKSLDTYLENQQGMDERTDKAGEKILKAKETLLSLQKELDQMNKQSKSTEKCLENLETAQEEVHKETHPLLDQVTQAITHPFKALGNLFSSSDQENKEKGDQPNAEENAPKEVPKGTPQEADKAEGKDKSLDQSQEGKGKSMPKTGLMSLGGVIGGIGATLIGAVTSYITIKKHKK